MEVISQPPVHHPAIALYVAVVFVVAANASVVAFLFAFVLLIPVEAVLPVAPPAAHWMVVAVLVGQPCLEDKGSVVVDFCSFFPTSRYHQGACQTLLPLLLLCDDVAARLRCVPQGLIQPTVGSADLRLSTSTIMTVIQFFF